MALSAIIHNISVQSNQSDPSGLPIILQFHAFVFGDGYAPANGSPERFNDYGLSAEILNGMTTGDIEDVMIQAVLHHVNVVEAANYAELLLKKNIVVPGYRGGL